MPRACDALSSLARINICAQAARVQATVRNVASVVSLVLLDDGRAIAVGTGPGMPLMGGRSESAPSPLGLLAHKLTEVGTAASALRAAHAPLVVFSIVHHSLLALSCPCCRAGAGAERGVLVGRGAVRPSSAKFRSRATMARC